MTLAEYNRKRTFSKTPEPQGVGSKRTTSPLHFVVQKHDASHLHYDFRLELDGVLKSWAIPKGPSMNPADKRLAMQTEDHPLSYIDFEGTIPKGNYGAGNVIVWDTGLYMSSETNDVAKSRKKVKAGFYKGELKFVLLGEKLRGAFTLIKMKQAKEENAWLLIKERDAYASSTDVTTLTHSVLSKKPLPQEKNKKRNKSHDPMPHEVKPMLAKLVAAPFNAPGWLFEVKWDGYRAIAEIEHGEVRIYSRRGQSFNALYTPIVKALRLLQHDCVLDGEIIALKNGKTDFHTLQEYRKRKAPLQYMLFDLLYLDGHDVRSLPLRQRKELLRELLPEQKQLVFSEHTETEGVAFFDVIRKNGIEGMIAKDATSTYREGVRSDAWRKIKNINEQEAVIVGFTEPRGSRKNLGALVLGAYINGTLTYIGHSGGGFTQTELRDIHHLLSKITVARSPFHTKVPVNAPVTWVQPRYVCSVQFTEWTPDGHMRHPIYRGLRTDKDPEEVTKETPVTIQQVKQHTETPTLTNLTKVFWSKEGYTKGDVIEYYDKISPILLPHLKDRPMVLNRHPHGAMKPGFFQKDTSDLILPSFVETKSIYSESNKKHIRYILVNNKETLLYIANLGCIELNPWESRVGSIRKPDYYIIDIDPNGRPFADVVKVAQVAHDILTKLCENSYPKTSGQTGLHIYVPLGGKYSYSTIRLFSEGVCRLIHARLPTITSLERNPEKRKGLIYLDYLRNVYGQTAAAAYSLRPYPGATISTPLEWSEVRKGLDPGKFTIKTIWKRLEKKGDLWKPVLTTAIDLEESIRCLKEVAKNL